ncbi:MAG: ATP-dependent DNA helicase RecG [Anaerolineae bacterium]|nr:ATP-dependent DNA helicase RecG [Anaerolineae bacterium]MCB9104155.1 ATP-dependent DNA helicase RecG [Anaerolineales bacterium]
MLSTFDKLSRMLTQEKRLGYKNKAVMGGLEKLAPNWSEEALQEASTDNERRIIEEVVQDLGRYPNVDDTDRPTFIHQILVKLHKADQPTRSNSSRDRKSAPPQEAAGQSEPEKAKADPPVQPESRSASPKRKPRSDARSAGRSNGATSASNRSSSSSSGRDFASTGLDSPVTKLPGIKDGMARKLANLGIVCIEDFLKHYPRRYDDYRALKPINQLEYNEDVTIIGQVWETRKRQARNNRSIITSVLTDGTATIEATWFNQPWLEKTFKPGMELVLSGRVEQYLGRLTFQSPEWEELDKDLVHTGRLVPVYPLTQGITSKWLRKQIRDAVNYWSRRLPDYLPDESRSRLDMLMLEEAVRQIHFPDDWETLEAARRRLAFDELLMIQLGVLRHRIEWRMQETQPIAIEPEKVTRILETLPFPLTGAQKRSIDEIIADLQLSVPMSRLLQGDVGSGKTVVALVAMVLAVIDGGQAAILAPTEILAEQHFKGMGQLLEQIGQAIGRSVNIQLLTGSVTGAQRNEVLDQLAQGQIDILVGTHAIIQSNVAFKNLRLAIIDEQHRFGVEQRSALRDKGFNPHLLVMTATPIPRTLALTLYGDLDLSLIDEMPPGRQPIKTRWLTPRERERAYSFIRSQIEKGRQAFIICPLVEESEKTEAKSAIEEHGRLQKQVFPRLKLGLLHGRMKGADKEKVMKEFKDQKLHILVSTSVVEVGIDIPNASVMLVEGANRFGLAQLHQFRGRVGRGQHNSYCLLLADNVTPEAKERLQAVEGTTNGFELAESDLKMRGPGEFFGTRQSGLPDLKLVQLTDVKLLELARQEAQIIFEKDEKLEQPQHRLLARQVENFWNNKSDLS